MEESFFGIKYFEKNLCFYVWMWPWWQIIKRGRGICSALLSSTMVNIYVKLYWKQRRMLISIFELMSIFWWRQVGGASCNKSVTETVVGSIFLGNFDENSSVNTYNDHKPAVTEHHSWLEWLFLLVKAIHLKMCISCHSLLFINFVIVQRLLSCFYGEPGLFSVISLNCNSQAREATWLVSWQGVCYWLRFQIVRTN